MALIHKRPSVLRRCLLQPASREVRHCYLVYIAAANLAPHAYHSVPSWVFPWRPMPGSSSTNGPPSHTLQVLRSIDEQMPKDARDEGLLDDAETDEDLAPHAAIGAEGERQWGNCAPALRAGFTSALLS
eukprot:scaffold25942_cov32-Tisochrysis_lutea.AAC.2